MVELQGLGRADRPGCGREQRDLGINGWARAWCGLAVAKAVKCTTGSDGNRFDESGGGFQRRQW